MFKPQIQNNNVLIALALIGLISVYWVSNSYKLIEKDNLDEKIKAVQSMDKYIKQIKKSSNFELNKNDIYGTGLLGSDTSLITTIQDSKDKNYLDSKLACTHPNFAALVVHLFKESELDEGDTVAVSMTGSLPGANLALLAACDAMGVHPIILSSVGSSAWGANREEFTWLDIESILYRNKLTNFKSQAVSIGGENDSGDNLTDEGIEIIEENIIANNAMLINESTLSKTIEYKTDLFDNELSLEKYKAYINIGGGSSSIGYGAAKDTMKVGVIFPIEINDILDEYEEFDESIAYNFLQNDVVFINIKSINVLAKNWGLYPPSTSIEKLSGDLFYEKEQYNIRTIIIALLINLFLITFIGIKSHRQIKRRMQNEEYDAVL